jgi:hypothetical protein
MINCAEDCPQCRATTDRLSDELAAAALPPPRDSAVVEPSYYTGKYGMRSRDVVTEFDMGVWGSAAFKYIVRHKKKGNPAADLRKAIRCLEYELEELERTR